MTDYPAISGRRVSYWKREQANRKWREILSVFVVCTLLFFILNGFIKTISLGRDINASSWDGKAGIAIALNTEPKSVMVYQKEPKKIAFFTIPGNLFYATGDAAEPVKTINSAYEGNVEGILTNVLGADVGKRIYFADNMAIAGNHASELFKNLASFKTAADIFVSGPGKVYRQSTMTKMEMLRLWWEIKGINIKDVDVINLDKLSEDVIGPGGVKFKGVDRSEMTRTIGSYLDSPSYFGGLKVEIINGSGASGAGKLASDMLSAWGIQVVGVENGQEEAKCKITGEKNAAISYLARELGCDIVAAPAEAEKGKIVIVLGRNFAAKYF